MAQDKSIIIVPPISFINNTLISASPIDTDADVLSIDLTIDTNETNTNTNPNVLGYNDVKKLANIDAEFTKEIGTTRGIGGNEATVQSSGGGSGPDGLGSTLDNAIDNSRLGGSNSGGGTPTF